MLSIPLRLPVMDLRGTIKEINTYILPLGIPLPWCIVHHKKTYIATMENVYTWDRLVCPDISNKNSQRLALKVNRGGGGR